MEHEDDIRRRLTALAEQPVPPALSASHLSQMRAVRHRAGWPAKVRVAAAFLAGLLVGGSGLAAAGALPDPMQHAAHQALDTVGVRVPDPERYHGEECGDEVKRNHGAYVRDDHSLARSDCGKPVGAGSESEGDGAEAKEDRGPCQGPPPWAKQKMTAEEKAAAQEARVAECGEEDGLDAEDEPEAQDAPEATTTTESATTTTAPTTTTEAPTTTDTTDTTEP